MKRTTPIRPASIDIDSDPGLSTFSPKSIQPVILPTGTTTTGTATTDTHSVQIIKNIYTVNPPGGANGEVQFNFGGSYTGDGGFTYNPSSDTLTTGTLNVYQLNPSRINISSISNLTVSGGSYNNVLKTDGAGVLSWASAFPSDAGNTGKFLKSNGINQEWANVSYANLVDIPGNIATTDYVGNAIANLVDSSPAALNTLNELANALGNNASFSTTITNQLANKASVASVTDLSNTVANITWANLSGAPNIDNYATTANLSALSNSVANITWANLSGAPTIPTDIANLTDLTSLLSGAGIALTDISIGTPSSASGGGNLSYANSTGVFTYTPPDLTSYLTTITNIFDQDLNTSNNVTFNSVITSNVHAVTGAPAIGAPTNAVGGAGSLLTISAGDGGIATTGINAGNGGNLTITAGDAGSDIGNPSWGNIGGTLVLRGGNSSRPYHGSDVQIHSGDSLTSPGLISLHTGTNQWTFGKTGDLTLANNATIIAPADNDLTLVVTVEYNICTLLTGGSGYGGGGSSSAISGGSGTGMMVGYGYGLSGQVVNVSVTTPGTGYVDGDILTMTAGSGATFVITRYNSAANPNTNTAPADWTFGTDGNLTLPLGGDIVDSTGTSVLGGQTFDQALNTSNNVSFSSVTTGNIFNTGNIEITTPYGTVADIDISTDWAGNGSSGGIDLWLKHSDGLYIKTRDGNNIWSFDDNGTLNFPTTSNVTAAAISIDNANAKISMSTDTGNISISPGSNNWTFGTDGNLTLPGNTFAVNYANGTQVSIGGGSGNTGNVTFDDNIVIGTGSNDGTSGLYLAPGNASIANSAVQYLRVRGGDVVTHIHLDTGNNQYYDQYFGDDGKYVKLANTGNVVIGSDDAVGNSAQWTFGTDGILTFPGNLVIAGNTNVLGTNAALITPAPDLPLIALSAGANGSVSSIWIEDPFNVGTSNIAAVYANPISGSKIVRIAVGQNGVGSGPNLWDFGTDGNITLPSGGDIVDSTGTSVLGGGGIALTDLSIGADNSASGTGAISYANTTGVFTYTPPVIPDVSGFALSSAIPADISNLTDTTSLLSGPAYQFKSANFNVSVKQTYLVSTTAGAITATLPASPATGDWFVVYDFDQKFSTNNLTLDGNGKNVRYWDIMGSPAGWTAGSATLTINQSYAGPVGTTAQRFVYNGTVWSRIA